MTTFLIALAVLIGGYVVYGAIAERVFGIDANRPTPAITKADGIDYVRLPLWKVFMIQFLNIAGTGPIFGAIMGIMFGPAAFLWIVLGTIFAGGVHDFLSAMISLRSGGLSLPEIVGNELGISAKMVMRGFTLLLLVLLGAVFVITPAQLIDAMTPEGMDVTFWCIAIFVYYLLATMLPIDKLIGNLYPIFGAVLLFMAIALMCMMLFGDVHIPDGMSEGLGNRYPGDQLFRHPLFPMLFISIACGAISGFHGTQSPLMARCLSNEKYARPVFYGAMVAEGIVALVWAAAAIAFTGGYDQLNAYMAAEGHGASTLVHDISMGWLGTVGGVMAVIGVIIAPISSGDTAMRSARLVIGDITHLPQRKIMNRLLICVPLFAITFGVMMMDFGTLWRYFAWCNQTLATFTLWAITCYLARHGRWFYLTLIPALFMTVVTSSYLLVAPRPEGFAMPQAFGVVAGLCCALLFLSLFLWYLRRLRQGKVHCPDY